MKNKIGVVLLGSILLILGVLLYFYYTQEKNVPDHVLHGTVINASMDTITIKTTSGSVYTFSTMDISKKSQNIQINDIVKIIYQGSVNHKEEVQKIKVRSIIKVVEEVDPVTQENVTPLAWQDHGLFEEFYFQAYQKLNELELDQKIGQLFFVRVPETGAIEAVSKYQFGGYILFGRDTKDKTPDQLRETIRSYQAASNIPMAIAVDEEGGTVVRISNNATLVASKFLSPQELYQAGGYELIAKDTKEKSNILKDLNINVNFAPVADVSTNADDYMYDRSFGKDALETSTYVETVIKASQGLGVSYTLKHFPGYGNNLNTHTGISIDQRSYDQFQNSDFLPFKAGIKAGAELILVSHNMIQCMDDGIPASLSSKVHNILRDELHYTGLVLTDDLAMDAIQKFSGDTSPVIKAIQGGNDMFITTEYEQSFEDIKQALQDGELSEEMINHLVFRILAWKYYKGLM